MSNKNLDERRIARTRCSIPLLTQLLKAELDTNNVTSNAPKDLEVIGVNQSFHDYLNGFFDMFVTSKEFKVITEGEEPPLIENFIFTKHSENEKKKKVDK
jgi:hypothetical protein